MNKPILFNTEMVRAILDGRKTVTRRVDKPLTSNYPMRAYEGETPEQWLSRWNYKPPYCVGDILYVRETWNQFYDGSFVYKADSKPNSGWRPSIHMPKEAARIFLRVTDARVDRLQDITVKDIEREGLYCDAPYTRDHFAYAPGMMIHWAKLWDSTIKLTDLDRYGWNANPWVWVIEFERCEKPEVTCDR